MWRRRRLEWRRRLGRRLRLKLLEARLERVRKICNMFILRLTYGLPHSSRARKVAPLLEQLGLDLF
jgi:hypothetical protein